MASDKKPENIELEDYLEKRDFEANEKTTPPIDEKVKIPALWAFEVYTPSFIESFHKGISKFGWEEDVWSINSDFQHSLDELRSRGSGSGWLNLGYIVNESTKSFGQVLKKQNSQKEFSALRPRYYSCCPVLPFLHANSYFQKIWLIP
ncbi:MAG: hypothetical protein JKP90_06740 [Desulfofustis sp. PB-SRB1]|nr:hypothetical protein [Desulfofustis sp. PB-SRB1]